MRGQLTRPAISCFAATLRCAESAADDSIMAANRSGLASPGKPGKRTKGITLIEVVIASTLLTLAIIPILKALISAHAGSIIIERRTRSLVLAETKLDDILARSIYNYDQDFSGSNLSLDGVYLCAVTDTPVTSDLRKVTVAVGYDASGDNTLAVGEVEVRLATLIARRW